MERPEAVLVTGGTGFVGSHVIQQLRLDSGGKFDAILMLVRDPSRVLDVDADGQTRENGKKRPFVAAARVDLASPDVHEQIISAAENFRVTAVIHLAAEVDISNKGKDNSTIVDTAIRGTASVLRAVSEGLKDVETLVLASSVAAVRPALRLNQLKIELDEESWNAPAPGLEEEEIRKTLDLFGGSVFRWLNEGSPEAIRGTAFARSRPYDFAKTYSEMYAHEWAADLRKRSGRDISLAAICPSLIVGPQLSARVAASNTAMKTLVDGGFGGLLPEMYWNFVDVRDVAECVVAALNRRTNGRVLATGTVASMKDCALILQRQFPNAQIASAKYHIPKPLMYIVALFDPRLSISFVRERVGVQVATYSRKRMRAVLGVEGIPLERTLHDTTVSFVEHGIVNADLSTAPKPKDRRLRWVALATLGVAAAVAGRAWYHQWQTFAGTILS